MVVLFSGEEGSKVVGKDEWKEGEGGGKYGGRAFV